MNEPARDPRNESINRSTIVCGEPLKLAARVAIVVILHGKSALGSLTVTYSRERGAGEKEADFFR